MLENLNCDLKKSELFTKEEIQALRTVLDLAEGNCLDATDPMVASDEDLLCQAQHQSKALELVYAILNKLSG